MAVDQIARMMAMDAAQQGGGGAVQSDWNQSDDTAPDYIKNKPDITLLVDSSGYIACNYGND